MRAEVIPESLVVRIPGAALMNGDAAMLARVKAVVATGKVVLAEGLISRETAGQLRREAVAFAKTATPVRRTNYSRGCADILHHDENGFRLRQWLAALRAGVKPRYRKIVSHKFLPWNAYGAAIQSTAAAMIHLRNALYGVDPDFTLKPGGEYFTVLQVQKYEKGGGFLGKHSDAEFHLRQGLSTALELILLLSTKHEDYEQGGLFIETGGRTYLVDDVAKPGDVVIYDVKHPHGCAPVDPGEQPDPEGWRGRWVMLTPPYSVKKYLDAAPAGAVQGAAA